MLEGMKAMKGYLIDPYVKLITHLVVGPEEVKRLLGAEYDDCELFDDGDHIIVYDAGASEAMTGGLYRFEGIFLAGRAAVFGNCTETGNLIDSSIAIEEVIRRVEWGFARLPEGYRIRLDCVS